MASTAKKDPQPQERPVLVTTEYKGVFFGYATETDGEIVKLRRARNCLMWTVIERGFMGLAAMGPSKGCRIGPPADIALRGITSVVEVTPVAMQAWESAPWA